LTTVLDSHRLTGPHLLGDRTGAALDVAIAGSVDAAVEHWRRQARRLLDLVGWEGEEIAARTFDGGASLVITAPIDGLYAATDLNEAAWEAAAAALAGGTPPDASLVADQLREAIVREHDPRLRALRDAARARGVTFLADDELASVGSGTGVRVWPRSDLPAPADVAWDEVHDIPVVLISGSNGKTTSARLIAAIAEASGLTAALTSTDGVHVGGIPLVEGDYAGPMGARLALRDPRADIAVLETARGGILRRGLAVERADVTLITNIAADHLDDFGVHDLATLAAAKLVTARVVRPTGRVVLNADDPGLARYALAVAPASWFALDRATPLLAIGLTAGGDGCYVEDGALILAQGGRPVPVARLDAIPIALAGAARYNVSNALGAVLVASVLGELPGGRTITIETMAEALRGFGTVGTNPGRGNLFELGGVRVLVDYGHNPHGLTALREAVDAFPSRRRLVVVGQAGDRGDEAIRELARAAWRLSPDRIVLKELPTLYRGREPGSVRAVLAGEFRRLGLPSEELVEVNTELEALESALEWAEPGDLVVMLTHEDRPAVIEKLETMRRG
jgi:UDP-N-acetylmuramyl tripeptide synthase